MSDQQPAREDQQPGEASGGPPAASALAGLPAGRAEQEVRKWLSEAEEECQVILARAQRQASRVRLEAKRLRLTTEAQSVQRRAESEAATLERDRQALEAAGGILSRAELEAVGIIASAHAAAAAIARDAHEEAARTRQEAQQAAARRLDEAQCQANELILGMGRELEEWRQASGGEAEEVRDELKLLRGGLAGLVHASQELYEASRALEGDATASGAQGTPEGGKAVAVAWMAGSWEPAPEASAVGFVDESADPAWKQLVDAVRENRISVVSMDPEEPTEPSGGLPS